MKLKVVDLFSGIGAFSLGLERAGMETVAFCEYDKACQKVLTKHWPKVELHNDIRKLKGTQLPETIDVMCGGFPCQDISVGGKQRGIKKGTRSGLWKEYKRLIGETKPTYIIIENVANLRSKGLTQVLKDLWEHGYDAEWFIISAKSIGAWHERERTWVVAFPHGYDFRLGLEAFATKEEKQKWWARAVAPFRNWWATQSPLCGTADGIATKLDERRRKTRIKQLGNTIVPQIPELIGRAIIQHEYKRRGTDPNQLSLEGAL